jgi:hypothetical protein
VTVVAIGWYTTTAVPSAAIGAAAAPWQAGISQAGLGLAWLVGATGVGRLRA